MWSIVADPEHTSRGTELLRRLKRDDPADKTRKAVGHAEVYWRTDIDADGDLVDDDPLCCDLKSRRVAKHDADAYLGRSGGAPEEPCLVVG